MMGATAALLPPVLKDGRGIAFAAAADHALRHDPWQACPLEVSHAQDEVLLELARQHGVAGPLYQAMSTRWQKERLLRVAQKLQRRRGTPWAVEEVMRLLGFTDAQVIDRLGLIRYDGEALHDGKYSFDSGFATIDRMDALRYNGAIIHDGQRTFGNPGKWSDYIIRLFVAPGSRPFMAFDRAHAALMAADWAPLRSCLAGWHARHVASTEVEDPAIAVSRIVGVVLMGQGGGPQLLKSYWAQRHADGSYSIRWRLRWGAIALSEISSVALALQGGSELARQTFPAIAACPGVAYEGQWALHKKEAA